MKHWYRLNLNVANAIRQDVNLNELFNNSRFKHEMVGFWSFHGADLDNILTTNWLAYMKSLNLEIESCLIFYRKPDYTHFEIHTDVSKIDFNPSIYALNWTLDPKDDSEMVWYNIPLESGELNIEFPITPYKTWDFEKFKNMEVERKIIGNNMMLVDVATPHNIITYKKERWAFSVRLKRQVNKINPITNWNDTVEYFKQFIVE
jgi:hypothetical protein